MTPLLAFAIGLALGALVIGIPCILALATLKGIGMEARDEHERQAMEAQG